MEHKTQAEMQQVAEEIRAWDAKRQNPEGWGIEYIEELYSLSDEVYSVKYANGAHIVWHREYGKLRPVSTWTYNASEDFADTHPSQLDEQEGKA